MKRLSALSLLLLAGPVFLTGCFKSTRLVQKIQAPEVYRSAGVDVLQQQISERDAAIKTLNASVLITASTGGGRTGKVTTYTSFKGYIFVRKPRNLRVIMQLPVVGSRALDMVSDGEHFTLVHASEHGDVWIEGSNKVANPSKNGLENLRPAVFLDSLLVPGVAEDEFVNLTESKRILESPENKRVAIEEPDYDLTLSKVKKGNVLRTTRVIHLSRTNLLPFQQDIYDEAGRVVTQATYDNYKDFDGIQFPTLVQMNRPLDEYSLKVQVTKLMLNQSLEDDQFELKVPPGAVVKKMD